MVATSEAPEIFADARTLYADALAMLAQGKLRNAAEKAWGATKRATDALILARTGELSHSSGRTSRRIFELARRDEAVKRLLEQYGHRQHQLHGRCFYDGNCEPEDGMAELIRETATYIQHAERLAQHDGR